MDHMLVGYPPRNVGNRQLTTSERVLDRVWVTLKGRHSIGRNRGISNRRLAKSALERLGQLGLPGEARRWRRNSTTRTRFDDSSDRLPAPALP